MSVSAPSAPPVPDHHAQFIELLDTSLAQNAFIKLVLAKYVGTEDELQRLIIKPVTVKEQACLSFVYRYKTRDITKNLPVADGVAAIAELLPASFKNAHLLALTDEAQLEYSKKNKSSLFKSKPQQLREAPSAEHNREKNRFLDLSRPFLADVLGQHQFDKGVVRKACAQQFDELGVMIRRRAGRLSGDGHEQNASGWECRAF